MPKIREISEQAGQMPRFSELGARERAFAILDKDSGCELLGETYGLHSPHLAAQGLETRADDGLILVRGEIDGHAVVIVSMDSSFMGGGIGEISGAKFAAALELALKECEKGNPVVPVVLLDSGGVRLQEANYGLLLISEIQDLVVRLRQYVPVIGVIPGRLGCFGGMSMTAALFSRLIMTERGRLMLNGPKVIEEEAGKDEWDSSDKSKVWNVAGAAHRIVQGLADEFAGDDAASIREAVRRYLPFGIMSKSACDETSENPVSGRAERIRRAIAEFAHAESPAGTKVMTECRGDAWFDALMLPGTERTTLPSVRVADAEIAGERCLLLAVVPDARSRFSRAAHGEVGLEQGLQLAAEIGRLMPSRTDTLEAGGGTSEDNEQMTADRTGLQSAIISADSPQPLPAPIIAMVDVPGQAYGFQEENNGLSYTCAAAVDSYIRARMTGHPVITVIVGNAVSGAFLTHGLQGSYLIALDDETIVVHAMSRRSAAKVTKRTTDELDEAAGKVPAIAYDIRSFHQLGAVRELVRLENHDAPTAADTDRMKQLIAAGIRDSRQNGCTLRNRLETANAAVWRAETLRVQELMKSAST